MNYASYNFKTDIPFSFHNENQGKSMKCTVLGLISTEVIWSGRNSYPDYMQSNEPFEAKVEKGKNYTQYFNLSKLKYEAKKPFIFADMHILYQANKIASLLLLIV